MVIEEVFKGDTDDAMKDAQHAAYSDVIVEWVSRAKEAFQAAELLTSSFTELGGLLSRRNRFDHRTVQGAHDIMAAWHRYRHGRPDLFKDQPPPGAALEMDWRAFASEEIGRLVENTEATRALLTAVAYANERRGMAAERRLAAILRERYAALPWKRSLEDEDAGVQQRLWDRERSQGQVG